MTFMQTLAGAFGGSGGQQGADSQDSTPGYKIATGSGASSYGGSFGGGSGGFSQGEWNVSTGNGSSGLNPMILVAVAVAAWLILRR